ncbi:MAG TPA: hypothetical protein VG838_15470 [Opitutaceae bacterium]|nr:hypothetical protein [Opitutaceae bacterium]
MNLRIILTAPPRPVAPGRRYGYLAFCLALAGWHLRWLAEHAWTRSHDVITVVIVALVLNHLAFRFRWPKAVAAGLRVTACAWCAAGLCWWAWRMAAGGF